MIETLEQRIEKQGKRIEKQGKRIEKQGKRIAIQGKKIEKLEKRIGKQEKRIEKQGKKIETLEQRIGKQEKKIEKLEMKISKLEDEVLIEQKKLRSEIRAGKLSNLRNLAVQLLVYIVGSRSRNRPNRRCFRLILQTEIRGETSSTVLFLPLVLMSMVMRRPSFGKNRTR